MKMITNFEFQKLIKQTFATVQSTGKRKSFGCGEGVVCQISTKGEVQFLAHITNEQGKRTNILLGGYPKLSLANARKKARELKEGIKINRIQAQEEANKAPIFKDFIEQLLEEIRTRGKNEKRFMTVRAYVPCLEPLFKLRMDAISTNLAVTTISAMKASDSKKHQTAKFLIQVFNEAILKGHVQTNPCQFLTRQFKKPKSEGYKWVEAQNLKSTFFEPLKTVPDFIKDFYLTACFTGLRLGSARALKWDWINFNTKEIKIPAEYMKMGRDYRIPITPELERLLINHKQEFANSEYVFYHWSKEDHKVNLKEAMPERHLQGPVTANCQGNCTIHGLRKSLRTWLAENGVSFDVSEACLSHEEKSAVVRAYLKYDFFKERMEALGNWENFILDQLPPEFKKRLS